MAEGQAKCDLDWFENGSKADWVKQFGIWAWWFGGRVGSQLGFSVLGFVGSVREMGCGQADDVWGFGLIIGGRFENWAQTEQNTNDDKMKAKDKLKIKTYNIKRYRRKIKHKKR